MTAALASYLGRRAIPNGLNRDDLEAMRRVAWKSAESVFDLRLDDPRIDEFERQFLTNLGNRLWGKR
jgi:hypothetical protein